METGDEEAREGQGDSAQEAWEGQAVREAREGQAAQTVSRKSFDWSRWSRKRKRCSG